MLPPGYTIYGYQTGNGGHGRPILAKDGVPDLTANQNGSVRYFRFPDEPALTYRLWTSPEWVVLPFGLIPTPDSHPGFLTVPGQYGLYMVKVPHPMAIPASQPTTVPTPLPPDSVGPTLHFADLLTTKPKRKRKSPEVVEMERLQAAVATTLGDVAGLELSPEQLLRMPEFQAAVKKAVKVERQKPTVTLKLERPE